MRVSTAILSFVMAFTVLARADDFLEQSWIERRASIEDHEWPIPPPAKWSERSIIHGNAEAIWDERWSKLDEQFAAGIRVALHLARDGHGLAARAEIPPLVRTLGLINAHSRNPGHDKRAARDHALDIAVGNRLAQAWHMLGRLDPRQEEDVTSFLRDLTAAAASAEQLEKSTLPLINKQRRRGQMEAAVRANVALSTAWVVSTAIPSLLFSVHTPWTVGLPIAGVAAGLTALRSRRRVPKRFEPDDQNRVGPLLARKCEELLEANTRHRPLGESKRNLESL